MLWQFIRRNWIAIIVGIAGLTAGFLLNVYANKQSEKRIIDQLTAEINSIKAQQKVGRSTPESQTRLIQLEAQLQLLTS